jgi:hypothetical protein
MIPLRLQRIVFFLKRILDCLSRTRENRYPFNAENHRKSWIQQSCKHRSMKTLRIRERNPVVWYSSNACQPIITPNALSQSIK